jgi:hypothetical protein
LACKYSTPNRLEVRASRSRLLGRTH